MSTVYIVDDDAAIRNSLGLLLDTAGLNAETYEDGAAFLATCKLETAGCILLDIAMPGMNGYEVQAELNNRGSQTPVIFLTGHGDVPMAVRALQAGATDFLEKPIQGEELLNHVRRALALDEENRQAQADTLRLRQCYARLSPREREIMALVVSSLSNKNIAQQLNLSPRTVEVHRIHVMNKMGLANVAELIKAAALCKT